MLTLTLYDIKEKKNEINYVKSLMISKIETFSYLMINRFSNKWTNFLKKNVTLIESF